MDELKLLLKAYESKLKDIERDLGGELINISTQADRVCGYTVINAQKIAYLQGQKFMIERIIDDIKESIDILSR